MERTTFRNASGLHHPQQKTTARDMAVLGRALLRNFPRHYSTFATRTFRACQVDVAAGGELVAPWGHRRRVPDGMAKSRSQAKDGEGGAWFRVAQASPHSGKSGTLKGNPGQAHAALGLR